MSTAHLLIKGKVQGVFFRVRAREMARLIRVTGWIKNTTEGHVEVLASGTKAQLAEFIDWCRAGPENARVETVDVRSVDHQEFESFEIIR